MPRPLPTAALLFALCLPGHAWSQNIPDGYAPAPWEQHRVALIPHVPFYLHLDAPKDPHGLDFRSAKTALEAHFIEQPYFILMSTLDVYTTLQTNDVRAQLLLANDRAREGFQAFKFNLDYIQAITALKDALKGYNTTIDSPHASILGEILAPDELGEVHQYLAFSKLEQQALAAPDGIATSGTSEITAHLRDFVRLAPEQILDPASHSPARVRLYADARREFLSDRRFREADVEEARLVARLLEVDFLVFARVVQSPSGDFTLELQIYDSAADAFVFEKSEGLPSDNAGAMERTDALLSRFSTCVTPKPTPPEFIEGDAGHVYLDVGAAYYQFLESPTTSPFDNIGATFAGTYMVNDYFGAMARMTLIFSGNNVQGDLLTTFTTFRGILGAHVSYNMRYFRPFLQGGLELAKATPFTASADIDCKTYGVSDPECTDLDNFDIALLVGFNIGGGFNIGFDPIFLTVQTSFAFYFFPFEEGKDINLPAGLSASLTYRF